MAHNHRLSREPRSHTTGSKPPVSGGRTFKVVLIGDGRHEEKDFTSRADAQAHLRELRSRGSGTIEVWEGANGGRHWRLESTTQLVRSSEPPSTGSSRSIRGVAAWQAEIERLRR